MSTPTISPQVFAILSHLIEERAGLHYSIADKDLLAEKVYPRAQESGFDSFLDYYYFLRYDPEGEAELQALIEQLVVHETYFFRELDPLKTLVTEVIAPLVAAGRKVRVWSAACATGEEPLTLAMLLDDAGLLPHVSILGTDISPRAIARAKQGTFSRRALRQLSHPAHLVHRYLSERPEGLAIEPALLRAVDFRMVNLLDATAVARLGTFDVILCRNVLIYFRDETALRVVASLTSALTPRGVLCVGVSESLMRLGNAVECEERGGAFFYRKGVGR